MRFEPSRVKGIPDLYLFAITILFSLVFYARSMNAWFVADDYEFAGIINFAKASQFFTGGFGGGNEYRPLIPLTYAFDEWIGGGSPVPFHLTNTILHAINAYLLYSISVAGGFRRLVAAFTTVALLLNPLAHESLLWISGRPVLLGAMFVLLAIRLFQANHPLALAGMGLSFLLALGTYEMAVVVPFVLAILCVLPRYRNKNHLIAVAITIAITGFYITFWLHLFQFRITRFPVEHSVTAMASCAVKALLHSLHGINRLLPGVLYGLVLLNFIRTKQGMRSTVLFLVLFTAAYLPFFLVHGYADRFAYLSSAAALMWFGSALADLPSARLAILCAAAQLVFFSAGMQNRIAMWNEAGEIARSIALQIYSLAPVPTAGSIVLIENAPRMYKHAYVFISGLPGAMGRVYNMPIEIRETGRREDYDHVFRWTGTQIVRVK